MTNHLPETKHGLFHAHAQGKVDFTLEVTFAEISIGEAMVISTEDAAIYIIKEQAMKFFGLVDGANAKLSRATDAPNETADGQASA